MIIELLILHMKGIKVNVRQNPWKDSSVSVPIALMKKSLERKIQHYGALCVRDISFSVNTTGGGNYGVIHFKVDPSIEQRIKQDVVEFVNGYMACYTDLERNQ